MHIILVPNRLATAKTLHITPRLLIAVAVGFFFLCFVTPFLLAWVGVHFKLPFAEELVVPVPQVQREQSFKADEYVRDNISAMAVKLGEMQARVMHLDSLGERIAKIVGVTAPKNEVRSKDGQGGPLIHPSRPLSANELQTEIDRLAEIVEQRSDTLIALESQLMERRIKNVLLPTMVPINANHVGSTFGRRVDPIAGVGAMHEGIDFVADAGTPVIASAGGVVLVAQFHPQYGNMVEVDHGNDFSSLYAHLSKINVKVGQIIKRGRNIGASGNTGRSTGPHLHFEVRFRGVAQNPDRFLQQGSQLALKSPVESKAGSASVKMAASPKNARVAATFNAPR